MRLLRKWMMLAAACVIAPMLAAGTSWAETRVVFVTHGQAADQYWSVVKHGMDDAGQRVPGEWFDVAVDWSVAAICSSAGES